MNQTKVYAWLKDYLEEEFGIQELNETDEFMGELGLSSLDVFNLIGDLEYDFGIKISEKMIRQMVAVKDMEAVIGEIIEAKIN